MTLLVSWVTQPLRIQPPVISFSRYLVFSTLRLCVNYSSRLPVFILHPGGAACR